MAGALALHLKFDGTDGATTFADSAGGASFTAGGDGGSMLTTGTKQFGTAALTCAGFGGPAWLWISRADFNAIGTLPFGFGGWIRWPAGSGGTSRVVHMGGSAATAFMIDVSSSGISTTIGGSGGTTVTHMTGLALAPDTWHFWFVGRDAGGVIRAAVNGTFGATTRTHAGTLGGAGQVNLCACIEVDAYFDDLWCVTDDPVWTTTFTPPTTEFVFPLAGGPPVEPPAPPPTLPPFVSPTMTTFINRLSCTVGNAPGASGNLITVGAAAPGRRSFGAGHDGALVDVTITDGSEWEVRRNCQYTHATATLSRGTLLDSSTGSAIALSASAIITVTPHADWATLISNTATRVPLPSSDPAVNYANIMAAITEAGTGGRVVFPAGRTYLLGRDIQPLAGQTVQFGQSRLKLPDQVSSTLTAGVGVTTVATPNPTAVFNVASSTGFYIGQSVGLEDRTTAGQRTYSAVRGAVTAVTSGQVTVQFAAVASSNLVVTINTTTFIETTATSHTFATGTTLCSISPLVSTSVANSRIKLVDLELDGNRANNAFGQRWELCPLLDMRAAKSRVDGLYIYDAPTDGFYFAALGSSASDVWIDRCNSMSMHIGAASTIGAQQSTLNRIWLDSPGLGTAVIGHYGGISSSFPAYPALGFSRLTDHLLISDVHISNSAGTTSTIGQAIGCITANDNFAVDFSNIHISGFNKGRGAIHISATGASAPMRVDFNQLHVDNCGPLTPGTFNAYEVCLIGNTSGTPPFADRITVRNSDFTDSPLVIRAANVSIENVNFTATTVAASATLTMLAGAASQGRVDLSNVRSTRPTGAGGGAPAANEYGTCMLANAVTVRGNDVSCIGGHLGFRVQNSADVEVSGLRCENNYNYGVLGMDGSTRLVLRGPRVRVTAGTAVQAPYAGIDLNSGGGALGASGYCSITAPDIDIVTTAATQYGIRLSPTAAVPCAVVGGKVKVSGTSTTPILSGGASGVGVVATVALSHTFTPGAAEVSSGNVVSTNL